MLYVAIWYVSIRYEGEGRTAVMNKINNQILCILLDYIYIYILLYSCLQLGSQRFFRHSSFVAGLRILHKDWHQYLYFLKIIGVSE